MGIFRSKDNISEAYQSLLALEKSLQTLLKTDDSKLDDIAQIVEEQSELMEKIEKSREIDQAYQQKSPAEFKQIMKEFSECREENKDLLREAMDQTLEDIDTAEQSHQLLLHYLQGERRTGEASSRRIDRKA